MTGVVADQRTLSIDRTLRGVPTQHQQLIRERYARLLPVLLILMRPRDIAERNRTWPGVQPTGKAGTSYLVPLQARLARDVIDAYAAQADEQRQELWQLFHAYCRYGPIALLDALPALLPELLDPNIETYAQFHRLAKHPRSNAGLYIRDLLTAYATDLGLPPLAPFVARYAFATDRKLDRWFFPEAAATEIVPKTTRRLNLNLDYPHRCWHFATWQLPVQCQLSQRHPLLVQPWLCWLQDTTTRTVMGLHLAPGSPTPHDTLLCLRWAIWHYGAPWWPARGVPDSIWLPPPLRQLPAAFGQVQRYLHCRLAQDDGGATITPAVAPFDVSAWIERLRHEAALWHQHTLHALYRQLLNDAQEACVAVSAASVPLSLREAGVSLPWSEGIAAALLLPSSGLQLVRHGVIKLHDVPFDAAACGIPDDQLVDVRYDPWDARTVWLVGAGAHVRRAAACAFEHHATWYDLVADPQSPCASPMIATATPAA